MSDRLLSCYNGLTTNQRQLPDLNLKMHLEHYNLMDRDEVLSLLANAGFKRFLIDWQFENCSDGAPIVAKEDSRIIGFNGVMPVKVQCMGNEIAAAWSCDFIVSPRFRRQGIGAALKQKLDTA